VPHDWLVSLMRNGILVDTAERAEPNRYRGYRQYVVQVYQFRLLQAVVIQRRGAGLRSIRHKVVQEDDGSLWKKLERIASRAVYVAGWQAGQVRLELRGKQVVVLACKELRECNKLEARHALSEWDHSIEQQVLVGMDPEFVLLREDGRIALASRFLRRGGIAGSDGIRVRDRIVHPVVELRPPPAGEPDELLRNVRGALIRAAHVIHDRHLRWVASGMPVRGLSLGGHIHISGIELTNEVVRVLDHYVALPFLMIEDSHSQRRRPAYGCLGDVRRQPHGGFEYRTLPSWLVAPQYTYAAIVLCKLAAVHSGHFKLRAWTDGTVQEAYYAGDKQALLPIIRQLHEEWLSLPAYAPYSKKLIPFWKKALHGTAWSWSSDLRETWKLFRYQSQP